jgi:hypothetical protein
LIHLSFVQLVCFYPHYFWHESQFFSRNMQLENVFRNKLHFHQKSSQVGRWFWYGLHFFQDMCNSIGFRYDLHDSQQICNSLKKYANFPKKCATTTGFHYELHFSWETCNRSWISCTFIKKYASSNRVFIRVILFIMICATPTGSPMTCTFLKKCATGLELVALL